MKEAMEFRYIAISKVFMVVALWKNFPDTGKMCVEINGKRMDRISVDRCERITDQWGGRLSIDIEL